MMGNSSLNTTEANADLAAMLERATRGPWFVSGVRVKLDRQDTHAICHYDETAKRDLNIANVWYDPRTNAGHADAALIARAPDLAAEVLRLTAANAALAAENARLGKRVEDARELIDNLLEAITASDRHGDRSLTITGPTYNLKWLLEAEEDACAWLAGGDA
jgi:GAF domain-containing protein